MLFAGLCRACYSRCVASGDKPWLKHKKAAAKKKDAFGDMALPEDDTANSSRPSADANSPSKKENKRPEESKSDEGRSEPGAASNEEDDMPPPKRSGAAMYAMAANAFDENSVPDFSGCVLVEVSLHFGTLQFSFRSHPLLPIISLPQTQAFFKKEWRGGQRSTHFSLRYHG